MLVGTHFCLPLIIAGIADLKRVKAGQSPQFSRAQLFFIGLGGVLPDLFSIHLSLQARHASPTHTLWFPVLIAPLLLLFALPRLRRQLATAFLAWIGVILHLLCDLISGGIPLFGLGQPIVGDYYLHPSLWVPADGVTILVTWYIFLSIRFILSKGTLVCDSCSWEEKLLANWRESHAKEKSEIPKDS